MKGIVFTEFLDFVAERYGDDMVDDIVEAADLPSGGAYTTVGTYSHEEMTGLCTALAVRTAEPPAQLVRTFGVRLSGTFAEQHPKFFMRAGSFFEFLESIEAHIHVEVRKLYPDAELPSFRVVERSETRMVMDYRSPRRLGSLAEGMIIGSARHFGVDASVKTMAFVDEAGEATRFAIDITPLIA